MKKLLIALLFLPMAVNATPSTPIVDAIVISVNDPSGSVTGYWIYCATTSGGQIDNSNRADAGLVDIIYPSTFSILLVTGLNYCTATSYDLIGIESQYSNELVIDVGTGGATQVPLPIPVINFR